MDWATYKVLAWRISTTMDAGFCVEALQDAMARNGKPEIFNTEQGRWIDNVFLERLWRSVKYECVYPDAFETGSKVPTAGSPTITTIAPFRPCRQNTGRSMWGYQSVWSWWAYSP